jgi:hypothetical protein
MNPPYSFNDNVQPWTCDGSPLLPGKILDIAAPHGSAEWTNGPRGGITIEATNSPTVYEFVIGKRGDKSGWEPDENGNYIRYFSQAAKGPQTEDLWHVKCHCGNEMIASSTDLTEDKVTSGGCGGGEYFYWPSS